MHDTPSLPRRIATAPRRTWLQRLLAVATLGTVFFLWLYLGSHLESPTATPLFEDRHGRFLAEGEAGPLGFWDLPDAVPERISACLLAVEDQRFRHHGGVDLRSLVRAFRNNIEGGPRQGASTIAMQVARLQKPGPRTYPKKVREIISAWFLTQKFGRQAVLRHYLKIVPQGNRMHGVAYAARRYFQKPLADLSWAEASVLAALPKAPGTMNLYRFQGRLAATARGERILNLLLERGQMDAATHRDAQRQLRQLVVPVKEVRPFHSVHAILQLQEAASGLASPITGPVRTSLDLDLQDKVDLLAHRTIESYRGAGAGNIAVIVAERETGGILSYLGSDVFQDPDYAGAIDYARTPRSSGSTLKPFLFALGLEHEVFSPASVLADLPVNITHEGGHYTASNYDDDYLGPLLYRRALANSRNIPAIQVLKKIGLSKAFHELGPLGLTDPSQDPAYYGLGLAIGGLYVRLIDLVGAYGVLANDGRSYQLNWGPSWQQEGARQLLSPATARSISLFLADSQARLPSFPRDTALEFSFPVAIKTGTSQGFRDAWTVAYSHRFIVGVWMGHPDHQKMNRVSGLAAASLAHRIMVHLHPDAQRGLGHRPFPIPKGYRAVSLCSLNGDLATDACTQPVSEYFKPGTEPLTPSQAHVDLAVDMATGLPSGPLTPAARVAVRTFTRLPSKYAQWAANHGFPEPPPKADAPKATHLSVQYPADGSRLIVDPDTPKSYQTMALRAQVQPRVPEVMWYVNGKPLCRATYPYQARWPMEPGTHRFQLRFPHADLWSEAVTVTIAQP